jgi:uncharacterized DUF497 family protein
MGGIYREGIALFDFDPDKGEANRVKHGIVFKRQTFKEDEEAVEVPSRTVFLTEQTNDRKNISKNRTALCRN